ncbi:MAG: RNA polymerase sigma factor [Candidatus Paceibacterota bacterium]|jgi:RNA polymerase sigma-70 factor (ECF subfamily)
MKTDKDLVDIRKSTDEQLAIMLKKDVNDNAFHELLYRYTDKIINFAFQYTNNRNDAEDIAQNTFFKVWKKIRSFKNGAKWKPWLYTIARNTAIDFTKKRKTFSFSDLDDIDADIAFGDTLVDPEPLPDEIFSHHNLLEELSHVMEKIHPDHRTVLIMHYHEEMTFDDIATILKKPMNTIKSWHNRSIIKLRNHLLHQID